MNAGDLNRLVSIERFTDTPDGAGGNTRSWALLLKVWAKANPIAGKEALLNGTLRSSAPWRIEIRRTDVTVKDRLVMDDGTVLNIASVADPDGRRESLLMFCDSEAS